MALFAISYKIDGKYNMEKTITIENEGEFL
jgi:hypothetical protein